MNGGLQRNFQLLFVYMYMYILRTYQTHENKQWKIAGSQKQFRLKNFETLPLVFIYLLVYLVFTLRECKCVCVYLLQILCHLLVALYCRPNFLSNNVQSKIIARVSLMHHSIRFHLYTCVCNDITTMTQIYQSKIYYHDIFYLENLLSL